MGNCCRAAPSSMDWGGDDWGSLRSSTTRTSKVFDEGQAWNEDVPEKKQLLGAVGGGSTESNGKVTIKISKKELEELMGAGVEKTKKKKREGRASAEQVLVRLLNARDHHAQHHGGPWRPVLQSIPEVN